MNTATPNYKNDIDSIPGLDGPIMRLTVAQVIAGALDGRCSNANVIMHLQTKIQPKLEEAYNKTPPAEGSAFKPTDHLKHCIELLTEDAWQAHVERSKRAGKIQSGIAGAMMAAILPVAGPLIFDRYADYAQHGTNAPSHELTRANRSSAIAKALLSDGVELSDYFDFITTRFDPALGREIPLSEAHDDPYHIVRAHAEWLSTKTRTDQETLENLGLYKPDL